MRYPNMFYCALSYGVNVNGPQDYTDCSRGHDKCRGRKCPDFVEADIFQKDGSVRRTGDD